jgi:hypothetical protein
MQQPDRRNINTNSDKMADFENELSRLVEPNRVICGRQTARPLVNWEYAYAWNSVRH